MKLSKRKPKSPNGVTMLYDGYTTPDEAAANRAPTSADVASKSASMERDITKKGKKKLSSANTMLQGSSTLG